jgi:carboxyl-terminal processing protease
MKRWFVTNKKLLARLFVIGVVAFGALTVSFTMADTDYFFNINKSIDIFGRIYKEVTLNYVDQVDPEKFMESGIDGLLESLDPYTNFINETEGDEVELITTGTYGGIGVTIGSRDNYITVLSLMEGYSAQREGILPGDRILEIDGKSMIGVKAEQVRALTRGEPGTQTHLKIQREGEKEPLTFTLTREQIQLKNVTYTAYVDSGIGYIKLEHFSQTAGNEVRLAIQDLKLRGQLNGLILDLRGNPGGLLDAAVEVVEKFVPKGSLIVSTRGRKPESEKKYFSEEDPLLPNVPLVVLVDHNSASASEIVAGALQDLDRAVIMGTRSFGKGLVQTVVPLSYNTQLKITTAKYYTPSGRCIQEIDYSHRDGDGFSAPIPDSVHNKFKTSNGRTVYEHGGITPDSVIELPVPSTINRELTRTLMYFKFATTYVSEHKNDGDTFAANDVLFDDFKRYLKEQDFTYQEDGEKKLDELTQIADKSNYGSEVREEIDRLRTELVKERAGSLDKYKNEILRALDIEIMSRYKAEHGRIAAEMQGDQQLQGAEGLFAQPPMFKRLIGGK